MIILQQQQKLFDENLERNKTRKTNHEIEFYFFSVFFFFDQIFRYLTFNNRKCLQFK